MGRITVDGEAAVFSLKEDAHPKSWNAGKGRINGKSKADVALNRKINQTEQSIREIYDRTLAKSGYVTAARIKNELSGVGNKAETLLGLFEEHNREYMQRVGIDRKITSYYHYRNVIQHLTRFIKSKYGLDDYPLKQLDETFIRNFDLYLRTDCRMLCNSVYTLVVRLKIVLKRAVHQGILLRNPFEDFVIGKPLYKFHLFVWKYCPILPEKRIQDIPELPFA
jgi:hypothetical protein